MKIVCPSKSNWSSPLQMVPIKKRPMASLWILQETQRENHFRQVSQLLHDKKICLTIDLVQAYNQIPVAEEDIPKTNITGCL